MIHRISLATDFTEEGAPAFRAALSLAVVCRARLDILHVGDSSERSEWQNFPHVRETLEAWQLLAPGSRQEDVQSLLGVGISKVEIHGGAPALGIADFVAKHTPDILVAAQPWSDWKAMVARRLSRDGGYASRGSAGTSVRAFVARSG